MRGLAYEEGARLFQMALDIGDPDLGDEQLSRLLIDLADAQWRSSDLEGCRTACVRVQHHVFIQRPPTRNRYPNPSLKKTGVAYLT